MSGQIIEKLVDLTPTLVDELYQLEVRVFENPLTREVLATELKGKSMLALIARRGGRAVGYKVGFKKSPGIFFSWIGGVDPDCRREGIATLLME